MAKQFSGISDSHRQFIQEQHIFFCVTAAPENRINLSPKGMDSLRILGPNRILRMNRTGSGNETAAHLRQDRRMTLMWCSFGKRPMIMRAYGSARTLHPRDADWADLAAHFPADFAARQLFDMHVEMLQTSCGYGVPFFEFTGERDTLQRWAQDRGPEGVKTYWAERNQTSIDGAPTGILEDGK